MRAALERLMSRRGNGAEVAAPAPVTPEPAAQAAIDLKQLDIAELQVLAEAKVAYFEQHDANMPERAQRKFIFDLQAKLATVDLTKLSDSEADLLASVRAQRLKAQQGALSEVGERLFILKLRGTIEQLTQLRGNTGPSAEEQTEAQRVYLAIERHPSIEIAELKKFQIVLQVIRLADLEPELKAFLEVEKARYAELHEDSEMPLDEQLAFADALNAQRDRDLATLDHLIDGSGFKDEEVEAIRFILSQKNITNSELGRGPMPYAERIQYVQKVIDNQHERAFLLQTAEAFRAQRMGGDTAVKVYDRPKTIDAEQARAIKETIAEQSGMSGGEGSEVSGSETDRTTDVSGADSGSGYSSSADAAVQPAQVRHEPVRRRLRSQRSGEVSGFRARLENLRHRLRAHLAESPGNTSTNFHAENRKLLALAVYGVASATGSLYKNGFDFTNPEIELAEEVNNDTDSETYSLDDQHESIRLADLLVASMQPTHAQQLASVPVPAQPQRQVRVGALGGAGADRIARVLAEPSQTTGQRPNLDDYLPNRLGGARDSSSVTASNERSGQAGSESEPAASSREGRARRRDGRRRPVVTPDSESDRSMSPPLPDARLSQDLPQEQPASVQPPLRSHVDEALAKQTPATRTADMAATLAQPRRGGHARQHAHPGGVQTLEVFTEHPDRPQYPQQERGHAQRSAAVRFQKAEEFFGDSAAGARFKELLAAAGDAFQRTPVSEIKGIGASPQRPPHDPTREPTAEERAAAQQARIEGYKARRLARLAAEGAEASSAAHQSKRERLAAYVREQTRRQNAQKPDRNALVDIIINGRKAKSAGRNRQKLDAVVGLSALMAKYQKKLVRKGKFSKAGGGANTLETYGLERWMVAKPQWNDIPRDWRQDSSLKTIRTAEHYGRCNFLFKQLAMCRQTMGPYVYALLEVISHMEKRKGSKLYEALVGQLKAIIMHPGALDAVELRAAEVFLVTLREQEFHNLESHVDAPAKQRFEQQFVVESASGKSSSTERTRRRGKRNAAKSNTVSIPPAFGLPSGGSWVSCVSRLSEVTRNRYNISQFPKTYEDAEPSALLWTEEQDTPRAEVYRRLEMALHHFWYAKGRKKLMPYLKGKAKAVKDVIARNLRAENVLDADKLHGCEVLENPGFIATLVRGAPAHVNELKARAAMVRAQLYAAEFLQLDSASGGVLFDVSNDNVSPSTADIRATYLGMMGALQDLLHRQEVSQELMGSNASSTRLGTMISYLWSLRHVLLDETQYKDVKQAEYALKEVRYAMDSIYTEFYSHFKKHRLQDPIFGSKNRRKYDTYRGVLRSLHKVLTFSLETRLQNHLKVSPARASQGHSRFETKIADHDQRLYTYMRDSEHADKLKFTIFKISAAIEVAERKYEAERVEQKARFSTRHRARGERASAFHASKKGRRDQARELRRHLQRYMSSGTKTLDEFCPYLFQRVTGSEWSDMLKMMRRIAIRGGALDSSLNKYLLLEKIYYVRSTDDLAFLQDMSVVMEQAVVAAAEAGGFDQPVDEDGEGDDATDTDTAASDHGDALDSESADGVMTMGRGH